MIYIKIYETMFMNEIDYQDHRWMKCDYVNETDFLMNVMNCVVHVHGWHLSNI
jgi:hypothetical protein